MLVGIDTLCHCLGFQAGQAFFGNRRLKPDPPGTGIRGKEAFVQQPGAAQAVQTDVRVLELLRDGKHAQAFDCVLDRYESKVYRLCCAVLRDQTLAEDTAQEALLRIWKALPRYDGRAALSTWIYAITRNRCFTAIERRRELQSLSDPAVELEVEAATTVDAKDSDDPPSLLRELVEALPERYRRVLTLYYYEERSVSETAELLGVPEGTVKTHLHRARSLLLEQLDRLGLKDVSLWLGRPA